MLHFLQKKKKYLVVIFYNQLLSCALYETKKSNSTLLKYQEFDAPADIFHQGILYNTTWLKSCLIEFIKNTLPIDGSVYVLDMVIKKNMPVSCYVTHLQLLIFSHFLGAPFKTLIPIKKVQTFMHHNQKKIEHVTTKLQNYSFAAIQYVSKEFI